MGPFTGWRALSRDPARRLQEWYQRKQLERGPRIVAVGGGTGLPVVLRGLKRHTANLTAVVTVADDGGSSGRLRGELGILPPGDIRNCLVALADTEPLMESLFQHRFRRGVGLAGHSFGNLFIAAMTEVTGDFEAAIVESSRVLKVRGTVVPSTLDHVVLEAELADGRVATGESTFSVAARDNPITRVRLRPAGPKPAAAAVKAIEEADAVVLGPGSLFTSIMPNLLVPGIRRALTRAASRGVPVILVMNVMTQPGETTGYGAADHLRVVREAVPDVVRVVITNTERIPADLRRKYQADGAQVVTIPTVTGADWRKVKIVRARLLDMDALTRDGLVRHSPDRLAAAIVEAIGHSAAPPAEEKPGRAR